MDATQKRAQLAAAADQVLRTFNLLSDPRRDILEVHGHLNSALPIIVYGFYTPQGLITYAPFKAQANRDPKVTANMPADAQGALVYIHRNFIDTKQNITLDDISTKWQLTKGTTIAANAAGYSTFCQHVPGTHKVTHLGASRYNLPQLFYSTLFLLAGHLAEEPLLKFSTRAEEIQMRVRSELGKHAKQYDNISGLAELLRNPSTPMP